MKKQTLGMTIASLRKEKGMTQLELGEKMGVTDKAVSKWERDLSCPDVETLPKLAKIFDISIDELMQAKSETDKVEGGKRPDSLADTALKGIGIAMGVAVTVLSFLGALDPEAAVRMLGIGLASISISMLRSSADFSGK